MAIHYQNSFMLHTVSFPLFFVGWLIYGLGPCDSVLIHIFDTNTMQPIEFNRDLQSWHLNGRVVKTSILNIDSLEKKYLFSY